MHAQILARYGAPARSARARRTYIITGGPEPSHGRELNVTVERDSQRE